MAVLITLCATVSHATEIHVRVDSYINPKMLKAEQVTQLNAFPAAFAQRLQHELPYWSLVVVPYDKVGAQPEIVMVVKEEFAGRLVLRLSTTGGSNPVYIEEDIYPAPHLNSGYPPFATLLADILRTVDRMVFQPAHLTTLREWIMRYVPVASGGRWSDRNTSPVLVLPLSWDNFKALRESSGFTIVGAWQDGSRGKATVMATSANRKLKFKAAGGNEYEAIVAAPRCCVSEPAVVEMADELGPRICGVSPQEVYVRYDSSAAKDSLFYVTRETVCRR
ncbi:MAG TPA: hypothetical protein VFN10_23420 [Thermoanaerobaculia bacterium]|nr:hypothetical protein [Thermoanaerobaculia bacterium]